MFIAHTPQHFILFVFIKEWCHTFNLLIMSVFMLCYIWMSNKVETEAFRQSPKTIHKSYSFTSDCYYWGLQYFPKVLNKHLLTENVTSITITGFVLFFLFQICLCVASHTTCGTNCCYRNENILALINIATASHFW